jgi:hypothetical protein
MTDINDYLIDQTRSDWDELLKDWAGLLPKEFTLWMVNRIGDLIIVVADGSVHMLDVGAEHISRIADNRDDFIVKVGDDNNANHWLAIPLVDACVAAGITLVAGQCYGFKTPPLLGGDYVMENMAPYSLAEHYSVLADIYRQIRDTPDRAQIELRVTE